MGGARISRRAADDPRRTKRPGNGGAVRRRIAAARTPPLGRRRAIRTPQLQAAVRNSITTGFCGGAAVASCYRRGAGGRRVRGTFGRAVRNADLASVSRQHAGNYPPHAGATRHRLRQDAEHLRRGETVGRIGRGVLRNASSGQRARRGRGAVGVAQTAGIRSKPPRWPLEPCWSRRTSSTTTWCCWHCRSPGCRGTPCTRRSCHGKNLSCFSYGCFHCSREC